MTLRKILFLLGFALVPGAAWMLIVSPAMAKRTESISRQQNAGQVVQEANKAVRQRDDLREKWEEFLPLADKALSNMGHDLNPLLIPRRVHNLARDTYRLKDIRIQPIATSETSHIREFSFTLNGPYERITGFVDELERGRQRIRFQTLKLMIQPGQTSKSKPDLSLSATFLVPVVPDAVVDESETDKNKSAQSGETQS